MSGVSGLHERRTAELEVEDDLKSSLGSALFFFFGVSCFFSESFLVLFFFPGDFLFRPFEGMDDLLSASQGVMSYKTQQEALEERSLTSAKSTFCVCSLILRFLNLLDRKKKSFFNKTLGFSMFFGHYVHNTTCLNY